jgi:hypothetical protein
MTKRCFYYTETMIFYINGVHPVSSCVLRCSYGFQPKAQHTAFFYPLDFFFLEKRRGNLVRSSTNISFKIERWPPQYFGIFLP